MDKNNLIFRDSLMVMDAALHSLMFLLDDLACGRAVKKVTVNDTDHVDFDGYLHLAQEKLAQLSTLAEEAKSDVVVATTDEVVIFGGTGGKHVCD